MKIAKKKRPPKKKRIVQREATDISAVKDPYTRAMLSMVEAQAEEKQLAIQDSMEEGEQVEFGLMSWKVPSRFAGKLVEVLSKSTGYCPKCWNEHSLKQTGELTLYKETDWASFVCPRCVVVWFQAGDLQNLEV